MPGQNVCVCVCVYSMEDLNLTKTSPMWEHQRMVRLILLEITVVFFTKLYRIMCLITALYCTNRLTRNHVCILCYFDHHIYSQVSQQAGRGWL